MEVKQIITKIKTGCLYGIVTSQYGTSIQDCALSLLKSGVFILQYREKNKESQICLEEALMLRKMTREYNACLIINDNPVLAKQVDADGVHVGQEDMSTTQARHIVGNNKIVGLSTHEAEQAKEAKKQPIDYIGVGPVFATKTKKDKPVAGLTYLSYVAREINLPFVAIGGISLDNLSEVISQGARTICIISDILQAESIQERAQKIQEKLQYELSL